jgi:hypothetical protein
VWVRIGRPAVAEPWPLANPSVGHESTAHEFTSRAKTCLEQGYRTREQRLLDDGGRGGRHRHDPINVNARSPHWRATRLNRLEVVALSAPEESTASTP